MTSFINIIGILANLLNGGSLIPSIKHVYDSKDLKSYPLTFLILMIIANILWIIYGIGKDATQTIVMGIIFTAYYACFLYWKLTWN